MLYSIPVRPSLQSALMVITQGWSLLTGSCAWKLTQKAEQPFEYVEEMSRACITRRLTEGESRIHVRGMQSSNLLINSEGGRRSMWEGSICSRRDGWHCT